MENSRLYRSRSLKETEKIGAILASFLRKYGVGILSGELGSGKTSLAQAIAKELGVKDYVHSPTFNLLHKHPLLGKKTLCHWDLYRIDSTLEAEQLGFFEEISHSQNLHLIEWPEIIHKHLNFSHLKIHCDSSKNGEHRFAVTIHEIKIPTRKEIEEFWKEFDLPKNIREHGKQVTRVALLIGKEWKKINSRINLKLLSASCLLHDLLRPLDFDPMQITPFQSELRNRLKKQFPDLKHEEAMQILMLERGYPEIGQVIAEHHFERISHHEFLPLTSEGKLLYYADKRVRHSEIVDLEERFRDGRMRNKHLLPPNNLEIEKAVFRMEREIFAPLKFKPEQVRKLIHHE